MEDEQSILDATEYILMALNNIKNFEEFIEYKEEIIKAIYDIRNSITNIINMKKYNANNLNYQKESYNLNNVNPSSISSMLGLKFNYDAYLNNMQLKNFSQNEPLFNSKFNQDMQNKNLNLKYINDNMSNNENSVNNIITTTSQDNSKKINISSKNNINNPKNMVLFSFKDENNNNFEPNQSNEDNIIYNKSIRNKFKIGSGSMDNNIINNINENQMNQINVNNANNVNNVNQPIENMNMYQIQNNQDLNNKQKSINKKEKLSLIADIVMKINSEDYFYEILTKLFGDDLTDKLMSSEVSDELLDAIQNSIKEIEELKKKDDLKNENQNININPSNAEDMEDQPKRFPIEQIMNPNIKQNINRNEDYNNNYQEYNFQQNLRKTGDDSKKMGNKNSGSKKEKPFISATSAYGNYFDPPLQKGGFSKLDEYKKP